MQGSSLSSVPGSQVGQSGQKEDKQWYVRDEDLRETLKRCSSDLGGATEVRPEW